MPMKVCKLILSFCLLFVVAIGPVTAASNKLKIKIKFVSAELIENNHVGNEWATSGTISNKKINEGDSVTLSLKSTDSIKIKVEAAELDKIPDVGTGNLSIKASTITKKTTKSIKVIVTENRGRYSGNSAEWKFTFELSKA